MPSANQNTEPAERSAVEIADVSHRYGSRLALEKLSLVIRPGELFAVLGPNGGGKTTLFRLLSTLIPLQSGGVRIFGHDLAREAMVIRRLIGVVFQAPSLDRKLTAIENIRVQAALYGLRGRELIERLDEVLDQFALNERAGELTERLSGGLRRRVELAKALIHRPRLLLLDEPSTGLDPAARSEVWRYLERLRKEHGTTIVLTTHYLEEADAADRLAILHEGRLVALGAPDALRSEIGGDTITIETDDAAGLAAAIQCQFSVSTRVVDNAIRLELPQGHQWLSRLVEAYPNRIRSARLGKPTLEDLFILRTGHRFWNGPSLNGSE